MAVRYEYRSHDETGSASLVIEGPVDIVLAEIEKLEESGYFDDFFVEAEENSETEK